MKTSQYSAIVLLSSSYRLQYKFNTQYYYYLQSLIEADIDILRVKTYNIKLTIPLTILFIVLTNKF